MKHYQVGGAVRDHLLGIPFKDRDWVVVGATEEEMLAQGFSLVEGNFPVFLHPETGDEYALARLETKRGVGYKGFEFETGPDITLEQDLLRRDLTINAMAQSEQGEIFDPYQGLADIERRFLRHVSPAFTEDPLRLLRVARFAARLGHLGFRLSHDTFRLMKQMVHADEIASLPVERFWMEMKEAMGAPQPWRFFEILHRCGALRLLFPELNQNWPESDGHNPKEIDPMAPLKRAVVSGLNTEGRFAVLAVEFLDPTEVVAVSERLPLDKVFLEALNDLSQAQSNCRLAAQRDAIATLSLIKQCRALQDISRLHNLISAYQVLEGEAQADLHLWFTEAVNCIKSISVDSILTAGIRGAGIGKALDKTRIDSLEKLAARLPTTS